MTGTSASELAERLRNRADTRNGTRASASDMNTYVVGYYSADDQKLDREAAAFLESLAQPVQGVVSDEMREAGAEAAAKFRDTGCSMRNLADHILDAALSARVAEASGEATLTPYYCTDCENHIRTLHNGRCGCGSGRVVAAPPQGDKALWEALVEADEALRVIASGSISEEGETVEQLERIIEANRECAANAEKVTRRALAALSITSAGRAALQTETDQRATGGGK